MICTYLSTHDRPFCITIFTLIMTIPTMPNRLIVLSSPRRKRVFDQRLDSIFVPIQVGHIADLVAYLADLHNIGDA